MMKTLMLFAMAMVLLQMPQEGSAACCRPHLNSAIEWVCGDCSSPTPCCGYKKCNFFCCACQCRGGCRRKRSPHSPFETVTVEEVSGTAHEVIAEADVDGDGRLSIQEAQMHGALKGVPAHESIVILNEMDVDNDGFLSVLEIDPVDNSSEM